MKAKLGKLKKIEVTQYTGFRSILKKSVFATLNAPESITLSYVLIAGEHLNWKCGGLVADKPLLFFDENSNALIKDIKASKELNLKTYSYGTCKMEQVGTDVTIYLCPEKGKLTQPSLLKPISKIVKAFKPKLFFEIVADLESIKPEASNTALLEGNEGTGPPSNTQTTETPPRVQSIGESLLKYHQKFQAIDKKVKSLDKSDPKRNKLLVNRTKVLKHLQHLCAAWTEEISPQQVELNLEANWEKVYTRWSTFFAKRKAAKEGTSTDQDAIKIEEERLYTKALADMERFFDDLEKGKTVDPSIIENDIQSLETHLAEWKKFAKGKSAFPAELKEMEKHLASVQNQWKKEKIRIEAYHKAVQKLDKALESEASEKEVIKLYKAAEALVNA